MTISSTSRLLSAFLLSTLICALPLSAQAKQSTSINQSENAEIYTSIGDALIKVTIKEGLPNAFGGSDIFGRKRERGFVEIRFMGIAKEGRAIFRRKSVDVFSNETTMSPSQSLFSSPSVVQSGDGVNVAIVGNSGGDATVEPLQPDTVEFSLDLSKHRLITVEDRVIEILSADSGGVSFIIRRRKK